MQGLAVPSKSKIGMRAFTLQMWRPHLVEAALGELVAFILTSSAVTCRTILHALPPGLNSVPVTRTILF